MLIAAARGTGWIARRANQLLDDPDRAFVGSPFLRLEVLPKAMFHRRFDEATLYETFFTAAEHWVEPDSHLAGRAYSVALRYGLSALDALHVAAALSVGAEELLTTEKLQKPIHRVTEIRVTTLHP